MDGASAGVVLPNELSAFIAQHQTSRGTVFADALTSAELKIPVSGPISATKATAIYGMHSYHQGKKPHGAIRHYIRQFTQPGELVLDPFCGSGSTPLAALLEGRAAVGLDRSPAAVFIASQHCRPPEPDETAQSWLAIAAAIQPELGWLYATRCDRCNGPAATCHTVYSARFDCSVCRKVSALFECPKVEGKSKAGKPKTIVACPVCMKRGETVDICRLGQRMAAVPVLAAYRCLGDCQPALAQRRYNDSDRKRRRYFRDFDLAKIEEIDALPIPHWHPQNEFPATFARWKTDLRSAGVTSVDQLYTRRNLWALAAIRAQVVKSEACPSALFALTAIALAASRMQRYSPNSGFPNMLLVGTYYLPPLGREVAVGDWYQGKLRALSRGFQAIRREMPPIASCRIDVGDARRLGIPDDSIDYIFTDPPYADAVQYGELNYVWESWLGTTDRWHEDEIVVSRGRCKDEFAWGDDLRKALAECYRVLKPGRWLSLCYHDASARRWAVVQHAIASAGFEIDTSSAATIETNQRSFNQLLSDKVNQRDLVISFRKPLARQIVIPPCNDNKRPVNKVPSVRIETIVRRVLRSYLATNPGAAKDRIFDHLIGRLVQMGRMEAHDFEAVLNRVACQKAERWYLRRGRKRIRLRRVMHCGLN